MAIIIYTYSNPYQLNKEPYWAMIKNSFQLCVSQTMVNGLCDQYTDFYKGKLTTIARFINNLYNDWESDATAIVQRAIIDNLIEYYDFSQIIGDDTISMDDIKISLRRNRSYVLQSVKTMFELGMSPNGIKMSELTYEQKCVVAIYKELLITHNEHFVLKDSFERSEIDEAITKTIADVQTDGKVLNEEIKYDPIVVHGVHQFTPIMLRTIEELSKYKNVIILFNYIPDFKNAYQTWLNVYAWFESKILVSNQIFHEENEESTGGIIANNIAALLSGSTASVDYSNKIDVIAFDNQTEFAGYVAKAFERAEKARKEDNYAHSALYYMDEQIYAANSSVNDILKIYFPEQFGERNFLDYPIGHFFVAVTNMWDEETQGMVIRDLKDVYDCLSCGIIYEKRAGLLVSLLDRCKLYVSNETTIRGIIKRLKKLKRSIANLEDDEASLKSFSRIECYDVGCDEIDDLINGLENLNEVVDSFFVDFKNQNNDFVKFYKKVVDVLVTKVLSKEEIDSEFRDIVVRVLQRIEEIKNVEAKASFDCLRETMQLYLQQIPKEGRGANWIVRNFEQIDGDILRRSSKRKAKIYHFACLSDQDMGITHRDEFPWPLDVNFFEVAQAPVDWKYQVFVTSRKEYKNFRRYALLYGLVFCKNKVLLSYIKNEGDEKKDLYYLLRVLNAKETSYEAKTPDWKKKSDRYICLNKPLYADFSQYDLMKYRLCKFRFLMEVAIEGKSVYKDDFLAKRYITIVLEHRARVYFSGNNYVRNIVYNYLIEQMDELRADFPFITQADAMDMISTAQDYIEKHSVYRGRFSRIGEQEKDYMRKREDFLSVPIGGNTDDFYREVFRNATQAEIDNTLNGEKLSKENYLKRYSGLCDKCADKDICLEIFRRVQTQ